MRAFLFGGRHGNSTFSEGVRGTFAGQSLDSPLLAKSREDKARTKAGSRTLIRESELEKVIVDGGKSPSPNKDRSSKL
jgi:hypothetical protein